MAYDTEQLMQRLQKLCLSLTTDEQASRGWHSELVIRQEQLLDVARILLEAGFSLGFITAIHLSPSCELVYQFVRWEDGYRVLVRFPAALQEPVPSLASQYQGAAWHEREIYDFFGITFAGHPGLKPLLLTRDEKGLNPLLKQAAAVKERAEIFSEHTT